MEGKTDKQICFDVGDKTYLKMDNSNRCFVDYKDVQGTKKGGKMEAEICDILSQQNSGDPFVAKHSRFEIGDYFEQEDGVYFEVSSVTVVDIRKRVKKLHRNSCVMQKIENLVN